MFVDVYIFVDAFVGDGEVRWFVHMCWFVATSGLVRVMAWPNFCWKLVRVRSPSFISKCNTSSKNRSV